MLLAAPYRRVSDPGRCTTPAAAGARGTSGAPPKAEFPRGRPSERTLRPAAVTSLPGLSVAARRPHSGSGRLTGRLGYTDWTGSRPRPSRRLCRPVHSRTHAPRGRTSRCRAESRGRPGAEAGATRQGLGRAPRRLAAGAGTRGQPAPRCRRPQGSSRTRKPGLSSRRWWQSGRPDLKTSRPCRTGRALAGARGAADPRGCATWGPRLAQRLECSVLSLESSDLPRRHPCPQPVAARCPPTSPRPESPVPLPNPLLTPASFPTPFPAG